MSALIDRQVSAVAGGVKYSRAENGVICIWYGNSVVNAYSLPDWRQIGHWNIEFPTGLDYNSQLQLAKVNIAEHMRDKHYPC